MWSTGILFIASLSFISLSSILSQVLEGNTGSSEPLLTHIFHKGAHSDHKAFDVLASLLKYNQCHPNAFILLEEMVLFKLHSSLLFHGGRPAVKEETI